MGREQRFVYDYGRRVLRRRIVSLADFFSTLTWACSGSQTVSASCAAECAVSGNGLSGEDAISLGSAFSTVYFKAGESEGAQDGNKDRAYIRTLQASSNVDNPAGLGSFCSSTDSRYCNGNTNSVDVGRSNDGAVAGNTNSYTIYIQTAPS